MFIVQVLYSVENNSEPFVEYYEVLKELCHVFLEEIDGLPLKRDIDFTIDLTSRDAYVKSLVSFIFRKKKQI